MTAAAPCAPERADFHPCASGAPATTTIIIPNPTGRDFEIPACAGCGRWIERYYSALDDGLDDADACEAAHSDDDSEAVA